MLTDIEALTRYVEHVRQTVLAATDGRQRWVRLFVLALAEAELARLKREEDATMDGKLHYTDKGKSLLDTALEAARAFSKSPKLRGLTGLKCQVNPAQVNELPQIIELNIDGGLRLSLPVVSSGQVQRGFVFVCGEQPSPLTPLSPSTRPSDGQSGCEGEGNLVAEAAR